jgi:hypothetical protein
MKNIFFALFGLFVFAAYGQDFKMRSVEFSVADATEMNAIPSNKLTNGTMVYREDVETIWIYDVDTWKDTGVGPDGTGGTPTDAQISTAFLNINPNTDLDGGDDVNNPATGDLDMNNFDINGIKALELTNGSVSMNLYFGGADAFEMSPDGTITNGIQYVAGSWRWGNNILVTEANAASLGLATAADYLPLDGSSPMTGTLDMNNQILDNIQFARFFDRDGDTHLWSIQEINNGAYQGDFGLGHIGVYNHIFPQSGTATEPNHVIKKLELDAAIGSASSGGIVAEGTFALSGTGTHSIPHGLGYAPSNTRISMGFENTDTGAIAGAEVYINSVDATNVNINATNIPAGTSVNWKIFGPNSTTPLSGSEVVSAIDTELGQADWKTRIPIYQDGALFTGTPDRINFTGPGVTLTSPVSDQVTVTITGGSADGLGPDGDKGDITVGGSGTTLTIDNNVITIDKMGDNSVGTAELSDGSITAAKIQTGVIGASELAMDAVGTDDLDDGANSPTDGYLVAVDNGNEFTYVDPSTLSDVKVDSESDESTINIGIANDLASLNAMTAAGNDIIVCKTCYDITTLWDTANGTITVNGKHATDDRTVDEATWTFNDFNGGEEVIVYTNRTSAPTLAGATYNELTDYSEGFVSGVDQVWTFFGTAISGTVDYIVTNR